MPRSIICNMSVKLAKTCITSYVVVKRSLFSEYEMGNSLNWHI